MKRASSWLAFAFIACSPGTAPTDGGSGGGGGGGGGGGAGGSSGQNTLTGDLAFPVELALHYRWGNFADGGHLAPGAPASVLLADHGACAVPFGTRSASVSVGVFDGGPLGPGTFPVGGSALMPPGGAAVSYSVLTDAGSVVLAYSSSGSVTLSEVTGQRISGSFAVTLVHADGGAGTYSASGAFSAPLNSCP